MPPSLENDEFIVVGSDLPEYARNNTKLPPLAAALDPREPVGRHSKRSSASRRSLRQDPLDRLRALPEVRPIPWYEGKELPIEKATLSDRVQTRSACLMASRGKINDPPCSHCATGLGRFSECISLDEFLSGACSTCHLAARGNSCSIRLKASTGTKSNEEPDDTQGSQTGTDNQRESQSSSVQPELAPEPQAPPAQHNPHFTRRAKEVRPPAQASTTSWTPVEHSTSNLKRKRETLQGTDVWKPSYVSPYRPIEPSPGNTPTLSRSPNIITPNSAAPEQLPMLNYIYRKDTAMNGTSQQHDLSRVTSPASSRPVAISTAQSTHRAASSEHANHPARRETSTPMSPSEQLLEQQHIRPPEPAEPARARRIDKSAASRPAPRQTPLFESLPRKKQTQIHGIIDGLQDDIKNCLQQAESMQKQLDQLRNLMGIDERSNGAATS